MQFRHSVIQAFALDILISWADVIFLNAVLVLSETESDSSLQGCPKIKRLQNYQSSINRIKTCRWDLIFFVKLKKCFDQAL